MKILILFFIFIGISCSEERTSKTETDEGLYLDSVYFRHYKREKKPYLISTISYAFNDSISESLDSMAMEKLLKLNIDSRSEKDPLGYIKNGDTIIVDLIHIPGDGKFGFGEIRTHGDTILLKLSGDVYKNFQRFPDS